MGLSVHEDLFFLEIIWFWAEKRPEFRWRPFFFWRSHDFGQNCVSIWLKTNNNLSQVRSQLFQASKKAPLPFAKSWLRDCLIYKKLKRTNKLGSAFNMGWLVGWCFIFGEKDSRLDTLNKFKCNQYLKYRQCVFGDRLRIDHYPDRRNWCGRRVCSLSSCNYCRYI